MNDKEKQIEEMKQELVNHCMKKSIDFSFASLRMYCEVLYKAGYRKQRSGKWEQKQHKKAEF